MTILLKRFQLTDAGLNPDGEQTFDGEVLTLGASSDRSIIVEWPGVQLRHAEAKLAEDNTLLVTSSAGDGFSVERSIVGKKKNAKTATLKSGQSFAIGNHSFNFTIEDEQAVITITVDETASKPSTKQFKTRLLDTGISKRKWSMWLLFLIALVFLASPLLNRAIENESASADLEDFLPVEISAYLPPVINQLRPSELNHLLATDASWNTGDFHPAHQFFAHDCSTCHNEAFTPVTKETCMSCHEAISYHFPPDSLQLHNVDEDNCQSCHKEHNGEDKLIIDNESLCIDCHQNLRQITFGKSVLRNVTDWQDSHPEITLNMASWDQVSQQWMYQQHDATKPPAEQSGLRFPHDLHLRESGFEVGEDQTKVLACADCHMPESGGELMLPIQMETHCESCHQLEVEVDQDVRRLQHGDIDEILVEIAGLKGLNALLPKQPNDATTQSGQASAPSKLKLPGKLDKSSQHAQQAVTLAASAKDLIERRGCVTCHTVDSDPEALEENRLNEVWKVRPVNVVRRWIDESEFDHGGHISMNCNACHTQITQSTTAEDVNIPSRAVCQNCHGNPDEDHLSASQCVDCHSYHIPDHGAMQASPAPKGVASQATTP